MQLLIDGSDANTAKLVAGYANQSSAPTTASMAVRPSRNRFKQCFGSGSIRGSIEKVLRPRHLCAGDHALSDALGGALGSREGEEKTILQVYVSNISANEFILGKIFGSMAVALTQAAILVAILLTYFGMQFAGDSTPFVASTILYAFCVASFGTWVGDAIPNQVAAVQAVALGGYLLVFMLSGVLVPIETMPHALQWLSNLVWGTYYTRVMRDALLQGGGWPAMWSNVGAIALFGALFYGLAWLNMRRMQVRG